MEKSVYEAFFDCRIFFVVWYGGFRDLVLGIVDFRWKRGDFD
jgi:hypothetical protein